ncbi:A/G-specific adenine glycosylase [Lampropedia aestuarii]|uniref:A/G-specific adenine glycosylase n=1 Tax=Lampropedia aestuarii TaxID=2562762 RepID=UPI0024691B3E|nr:A/G-specific adenine glycosylase [Lampropedia aestuarii]MDH5856321.1 A/G-specific adenine glycosylase [Lampropedia aestuarii]
MQNTFSDALVAWQRSHGRQGLPWQNTQDPYRVWLSEIMLQQTQVQTVLGYYQRFLNAFPTVQDLAAASVDEVMPYWSGLGYYSRARNLHRAAQMVVERFGGQFPQDPDLLIELPGIGRSTAHAIASFCFGLPHTIFDANVQRVMARYWAFDQDLAGTAAVRTLWSMAQTLVPSQGGLDTMPAYTQGLMDLGATVCTAKHPQCSACPVQRSCRALQSGLVDVLPRKTRKLKRTTSTWYWLVIVHGDQIVLDKRPDTGIWAQLYCFETFASEAELEAAWQQLSGDSSQLQWHGSFKHVLTHKDLHLVPVVVHLSDMPLPAAEHLLQQVALDSTKKWADVQAVLAGQWAVPAPLLAWLTHTELGEAVGYR